MELYNAIAELKDMGDPVVYNGPNGEPFDEDEAHNAYMCALRYSEALGRKTKVFQHRGSVFVVLLENAG